MPPGRAAAPSPASSAPRLRARPAAPSPPASDASRPTSLHPELPFPARALPQGPGMLRFTPDSALNNARVVIEHLLKLQYSPARDSRNKWRASVREHRNRLQLDPDKSLKA